MGEHQSPDHGTSDVTCTSGLMPYALCQEEEDFEEMDNEAGSRKTSSPTRSQGASARGYAADCVLL